MKTLVYGSNPFKSNFTTIESFESNLQDFDNIIINKKISDISDSDIEMILSQQLCIIGFNIEISCTFCDFFITTERCDFKEFSKLFTARYVLYFSNYFQEDFYEHLNIILNESPKRTSPPQYISNNDKDLLKRKIVYNMSNIIKKSDIDKILNGSVLPISYKPSRMNIVKRILYNVTGDPDFDYPELYEKLFTKSLIGLIKILLDYIVTNYNNIDGNINRCNWSKYIPNSLIIFDTHVYKTFSNNFYSQQQIIPYTQEWIGFIYKYSDFEILVQNKLFIASLGTCKTLVVPTITLLEQVLEVKKSSNIPNIPAITLLQYPVEPIIPTFTWDNFYKNDKRLLCYCDNFSMYLLDSPFRKYTTIKLEYTSTNNNIIDSFLKKSIESVTVITSKQHFESNGTSNEYYDTTNSNCDVVFIDTDDYLDILLKCIIQNIPVIVRKNTETIEILGIDYPLFFDGEFVFPDINTLKNTYRYILDIDKKKYTVEEFQKGINQLL